LQIEITHSCADYPSATATAPAPGKASPLGNHLSGVSVRHWHPMTTGYRNPRHGCNLVRISWGLIKIANYEFIKADQIPRRGPLRRLSLRPENALHWPETAGFRVTGIGTGTETGNGIRIPSPVLATFSQWVDWANFEYCLHFRTGFFVIQPFRPWVVKAFL